jgi:hypothetical protein
VTQDVDGDGVALVMRKPDPGGEFVESTEVRGLMLERQLEDLGPYYKIYPEGVIENFDGVTIPSPVYLSDNRPDLNRNFPFEWHPEHEQIGAGTFPMSEPESRAVVEFTSRRPHLFAWLNFHTFGGVFIRPLGDKPGFEDGPGGPRAVSPDRSVVRDLHRLPDVSGFEEFTTSRTSRSAAIFPSTPTTSAAASRSRSSCGTCSRSSASRRRSASSTAIRTSSVPTW